MATDVSVQAAVVDLERQSLLLLHALTGIEEAARADLAAFRIALAKIHEGAASLRQQVVR
jgi:hypothetical protein